VIGLAAGLFSLGSGAFFSDTETDTGNTFTAGTLDLTLTDDDDFAGDSETATWVFGPIKPGDSGTGTLDVTNAGNIAGFLDLSSVAVVNTEGANPESETNTEGDGELGAHLTVTVCWDTDNDGDCDDEIAADIIFGPGTLNAFAAGTPYDEDEPLAAGATKYITIEWVWTSSGTDNDAQGDIATLSFTVELDQTAD
jgi:predicted ribosomally synthesized peptide with SipW-like signal peptide